MTEPTNANTTERDDRGRFAPGGPGGPGRPPRATEVVYMRALSDVLTLDAWRDICETAINSARDGDAKAREWVARYALGDTPTTLQALAVMEANELQPVDLVEAEAALESAEARGEFGDQMARIFRHERPTTLSAAIQRRAQDVAARQAEADRAKRKAQADRRAAARQAETAQVVDDDPEAAPANADQVTPADTV